MEYTSIGIEKARSSAGSASNAWTGPGLVSDWLIRAMDITITSIALVFFAPLMLLIAISVYAANPGPIIFAQRRLGLNGKTFHCFKFRTMAVDAAERLQELLLRDPAAREEWERDHKLRNDPRIVGIGRILRKTSLDELPQLINVLLGDMSLVGPRPIVDAEIERYGRYFAFYCSVKPGISGLWQVSGRNDVSYRRRVAIDVKYCSSRSIYLYLKILVLTVPNVIFAKGTY